MYVNHSSVFDQVKHAYEITDESVQAIADRLDVHYVTIHKWARKYDWKRRGGRAGIRRDEINRLRTAYETDFTREVIDIAEEFGVSARTVGGYAKRFGWKQRHNSQYHKTETHKQCLHCGEWLPKSEYKNGGVCKLCQRAKKYGTTKQVILELFDLQGGRCGICDHKFTSADKWCIDHDHKTGEVRGILCDDCNVGLGRFRDDPKRTDRATRWLTNGGIENGYTISR